eukprot:SAG31_NODE_8782_length_1388_cov_1.468580_1_plen_281_part_10
MSGLFLGAIDRALSTLPRLPLSPLRRHARRHQFHDRIDAVTSACCDDNENATLCEGGLTESCSYSCGKVFVPFVDDCDLILQSLNVYDSQQSEAYLAFKNECLQIDPKTTVMAIHNSYCVVCGDGIVNGDEECDEEELNSEEPDANCRTNCELARCGDSVVDSGEQCDDGPLNGDDVQCSSNCTRCIVSCQEQLVYDSASTSGVYTTCGRDGHPESFSVYCDMETSGGGWTLTMTVNPVDHSSVAYNNFAFWSTEDEYGSFETFASRDYKSPVAYTLAADE